MFRPINKGGKVRPTRLTDRSVANVVKHRAELLGLDPKAFDRIQGDQAQGQGCQLGVASFP